MGIHFGNKETMLAKLETNIGAIVVGARSMKKVDRQHYENFENYEYPSAFINDVREPRTPYLKDVVKVLWSVVVIVFDHSEGDDLSTKLNALIAATKAKLKSDTDLNGQAYTVKTVQIDTDEGFLFPHCVAIFTLEILYLSQT